MPTTEERLAKIYDVVIKLEAEMDHLVSKEECMVQYHCLSTRINRVYIVAGTVSGIFAFVGGALGMFISVKGLF